MIINIGQIVIDSDQIIDSKSFTINPNKNDDVFNISGDSKNVFLITDSGFKLTDSIGIAAINSFKIRIVPDPLLTSQQISVNLTGVKSSTQITIVGSIVVNSVNRLPVLVGTATNCDLTIDRIVKIKLDQSSHDRCSVALAATITDGVPDYVIRSKNNINISQDIDIVKNSLSVSFTSNTLNILLTNPTYGGFPNGDYGFMNEYQYVISFIREVILNGITYEYNFEIEIDFKSENILIEDLRIQPAIFNNQNWHALISYDFRLNKLLQQKQFKIGFDKTYSIPSRVSTIIPEAMKFSLSASYMPLELYVLTQSVVSTYFYSLKMIVEINLLPNRALVTKNVNIPMVLEFNNYRHDFNLPVRLNG